MDRLDQFQCRRNDADIENRHAHIEGKPIQKRHADAVPRAQLRNRQDEVEHEQPRGQRDNKLQGKLHHEERIVPQIQSQLGEHRPDRFKDLNKDAPVKSDEQDQDRDHAHDRGEQLRNERGEQF